MKYPIYSEGRGQESGGATMRVQKNSELRYRRLFETAQDGILILDAKTGMIEDVNPFLIKMLGYSREEFVKKKALGSWCVQGY
jgi:PAS domain-containing protein